MKVIIVSKIKLMSYVFAELSNYKKSSKKLYNFQHYFVERPKEQKIIVTTNILPFIFLSNLVFKTIYYTNYVFFTIINCLQ